MNSFELARSRAAIRPTRESSLAVGEKAFAVAERLHAQGDQRAIDYWARTIAWMDDAQRRKGVAADPRSWRASQVRQSASVRLLSFGQTYGRLDPASHLLVYGAMGACVVPVNHQKFAWQPRDFHRLLVFAPPPKAAGNVGGRGIPLVVLTPPHPEALPNRLGECPTQHHSDLDDDELSGDAKFLASETPFAATALIHLPISIFEETAAGDTEYPSNLDDAAVTLVNPLAVEPRGGGAGLAQCPSMPLIYARQASQYEPIAAFVLGDNGVDRPELRFLEPYQADKIPLIFVHGLISAPATFLEVADVVRAVPSLRNRYQIWIFRYPTGDDFFESASELRQQLADAFACQHDSTSRRGVVGTDYPPQRAVIVGHSLGGLLSKLQVTNSEDRLWRAVSNLPLDQLQGSQKDIAELRKSFFFNANPQIGRVVYIATPHQGSPWASRGIGRLATSLAGGQTTEREGYQQIVANNPGVFLGPFSESPPSSVELLRSNNPLLLALAATPSSPDVIVNSIIGKSLRLPRAGPSDVVVPVDSAYRPEAATTTIIDATHTSILRSSDAQQALLGILEQHLQTPTIFSETTITSDHQSRLLPTLKTRQ